MAASKKTASRKRSRPAAEAYESLEQLAKQAEFAERVAEEEEEHAGPRRPDQPGRLRTHPEKKLGDRIREIRESKFLTQGDLAELTKSLDSEEKGISRAVISLYEKGTNRPSPTELRLLCEALRVTPNYLIYGDEQPFHTLREYDRLGTRDRHTPEGYAWVAYVMAHIHHNHYDAVMKLVLDLARGWNKSFDQGLQEKANAEFLEKAEQLQQQLAKRAAQAAKSKATQKK
jgi:transcriptional regulator with XRE-family HTH domain